MLLYESIFNLNDAMIVLTSWTLDISDQLEGRKWKNK